MSQDACWAGLAFGFEVEPKLGLQFDGFGRFGQHHKAVGFGFGAGENGRVVGKRFVHQGARALAGRGVGYKIAVFGGDFGIERVVDVFMRVGNVFGVFGNHERIYPDAYACFGGEHLDVVVADFGGAAFGDVQIAAVADGNA